MKRYALCAGLLLAGAFASPATGQTADDLAAKFGALEAVGQVSLSPDGTKVAYVSPRKASGQVLTIADLTGKAPPKAILAESHARETLTRCNWATDARLICRLYVTFDVTGHLLGFTRLFAINVDGTGIAMLTRDGNAGEIGVAQSGGRVIDWTVPDAPGHVLFEKVFVPVQSSAAGEGTNIVRRDEGLGVEDLDVVTLKRRTVERAKREAAEYITDGRGVVRVMGFQSSDGTEQLLGRIHYVFRKARSRDWQDLSTLRFQGGSTSTGFNPYAVDPAKDEVYGFDDHDGRKALYSLSLDGNSQRTLLLSRPDVDIDSLVRIGRNGRVVGASYATEKRTIDYFDPQLKTLSAALEKALPGHPGVYFVDSSADESKLLLFAASDTDPGMFYMFDKATHQLGQVLPVRPELQGVAMGEMKPITYTATDGTKIPAYLTLPPGSSGKNLPAIVMPHGGPSARDEWGFDWLVQYFATRGYAVIQPNYRGSAGYGADFYQHNGFRSWRTAIGDVNDAGRWLVAQGIAAPSKLAIFGWSYGGYAALQTSVLDPALYKAIVAVAPVTDLQHLGEESRDYANHKLVLQEIGEGPQVVEGSPARNAGRIIAPVLMFHGDKDQNVDVEESKFMAEKLRDAGKQVDLVIFPGLDHQLPSAEARTRLLSQSDAFLRKALRL
jgi:dipeptidyl aminopeptidase/acylaminoacyl peptidase